MPRKDAIRLGIEAEDLGGGGTLSTQRNYNYSVELGSHYGYGGFVSINGEQDGAGRVLLGVNKETDEGVILLRTPGGDDPENDDMKTLTKLGNGEPPTYRVHEDGETQEN